LLADVEDFCLSPALPRIFSIEFPSHSSLPLSRILIESVRCHCVVLISRSPRVRRPPAFRHSFWYSARSNFYYPSTGLVFFVFLFFLFLKVYSWLIPGKSRPCQGCPPPPPSKVFTWFKPPSLPFFPFLQDRLRGFYPSACSFFLFPPNIVPSGFSPECSTPLTGPPKEAMAGSLWASRFLPFLGA